MLSLGVAAPFHLFRPATLNPKSNLASLVLLTPRSLNPPHSRQWRRGVACASLEHGVEEIEGDEELDSSVFEELFPPVQRVERLVGQRVKGLPSPQSTLIPDDWKPVQQYLHRTKQERREESLALQKYWAKRKALEERATPEEIVEIERKFARGEELVSPNAVRGTNLVAMHEEGELDPLFVGRKDKVVVVEKVSQEDIDNEQRFLRGESLVWADDAEESTTADAVDEWQDDQEEQPSRGVGEANPRSGRAKPKDFRSELQLTSFQDIARSLTEKEIRSEQSEEIEQIKDSVSEDLQALKGQKVFLTAEEKAVLRNKKLDFAKVSSETWSPLHTLAAAGQVYLAAELLKRGVDIDREDNDGLTPLHIAVRSGRKTMVRMLLKAGANPLVFDKAGATLLHYSAEIGNHEISKLLIRHGVDVNAADKDGWTPLHVAVQSGRTELIKALAYRGADITIENKDGNTAFDLALAFGGCFRFYEAIKFLKKQLTFNSMYSERSEDNESFDCSAEDNESLNSSDNEAFSSMNYDSFADSSEEIDAHA